MERLVRTLRMEFFVALLWSAVLVALFETEVWPAGEMAGRPVAGYCMNVAGVMMMCVMVPVALKLFAFRFVRNAFSATDASDFPRRYRRWAEVRLSMLAVTGWTNLVFYYLTLDSAGAFCALVALLALCLCWPSAARVGHEAGMQPLPEAGTTEERQEEA